jgi:hypothetical protein
MITKSKETYGMNQRRQSSQILADMKDRGRDAKKPRLNICGVKNKTRDFSYTNMYKTKMILAKERG